MREQVRSAAIDLMLHRGFAATTVDDIAFACGVSRRSFYRYFGTREDLVLGSTESQVAVLVAALEARPPSEDPWTALVRAAESLPGAGEPQERALAVARLISNDPDLRARQLEKHAAWRSALAPLIVKRTERTTAPLSLVGAAAVVASALSCLDVASQAWVDHDGNGTLASFYAEAVAAVRT